jgi:hypothetical protein
MADVYRGACTIISVIKQKSKERARNLLPDIGACYDFKVEY